MKVGTGPKKVEIFREYSDLSLLQNYLTVPKIYDYTVTDNQATIILGKMLGFPLHMIIHFLESQTIFLIIANILKTFIKYQIMLRKTLKSLLFRN